LVWLEKCVLKGGRTLKGWVLDTSVPGTDSKAVDPQTNARDLLSRNAPVSPVSDQPTCEFVRVRQTENNWQDSNSSTLCAIELFVTLIGCCTFGKRSLLPAVFKDMADLPRVKCLPFQIWPSLWTVLKGPAKH
jgi:hypothetical protein